MSFVWNWPQITWLVMFAIGVIGSTAKGRPIGVVGGVVGIVILFFGGFFTGGVSP